MSSIQTKMINKTTRAQGKLSTIMTIPKDHHGWIQAYLIFNATVISDRKQIQNVISSTEIVTNES